MKLSLSATNALHGEIILPGDKSLSHRAALFASLAPGKSVIRRFLNSGVTQAMLRSLTELGIDWSLNDDCLIVQSNGIDHFRMPMTPLSCGNSATTIRMLTGALAASGVPCVLDGSPGLRRRPMDRIITPLTQMHVPISSVNGCAPLTLAARGATQPLQAITYHLPVASAQVKSALILAALAGNGATTISEPGPSRDHTERMLSAMGAAITTDSQNRSVTVQPLAESLTPLDITLPGDISSAAFLLVAAAIVPDSQITIKDVGINPTRTGIIDVLRQMGAEINIENEVVRYEEPVADLTIKTRPLKAVEVHGEMVVRMIDEFPVFAIAAAFADGTTVVRDALELRYKESDRISTLCGELKRIGIQVEELSDGFAITGGTCAGGCCDSHGDHRLAMSLALAGLRSSNPITVNNAEILNESFPDFVNNLIKLGCEQISPATLC